MDVPMVAKTLNDYLVVKGPTGLRDLLTSKKIDLVNAATGTKYLQTVPKQMLFFFCGLRNIGRYLRNTPNASTSQQLQLPDGACEYVGLKHVIHWMQSACANPAYCQELRAPKSMYIAISMSRALRVLGLHADAARIDKWIWKVWFNHALTVTQIKKLWLGFPHDSKYNYHAVENIKRTILSQDPTIQQRKAEVMAHLMDPYTDQELKDRVFIEGVNQRYRPETPAQRATRLTSMRETARARESIERNDALLATLENNRVVTPPDPATDAAPGLSGTVSVPTVVVDAVPVNSGHTITHSATDSGAENVDDAAPAVRAATGVTLNQTTDSHLAAGLAVYDEATTALSEFHLSDNESPREDDGGRRNSM